MPRRRRSEGDESVSAVIITANPDAKHLAWTLDSLAEQTLPPKDVVIVDDTDGELKANVNGIPTQVVEQNGTGLANAREQGVKNADGDYIVEMDEDTVLLSDTYLERAVDELQRDGISGTGGVVYPIRGNMEGRAIALADKFNPTDLGTHTLVYPRRLCETRDGNVCYPMNDRGEDLAIRQRLNEFGDISRMNDQPVLKDLPTQRQEQGRNTVLWSVAGGVISGLVVSALERYARDAGDDAIEALRGSFSGTGN